MSNATPPTPSLSQPSQEAMELAERIGKLFSLASHSPYIEEITRLIDAHTAGLRREVEAITKERDKIRDIWKDLRKTADAILLDDVMLRADLARPTEERDKLANLLHAAAVRGDNMQSEVARLTAALEERGRDSERLDWLAHKSYRKPGPVSFQPVHCIVDSSVWAPRTYAINEKPAALRAAIDAARSAARKEPGTPGAGGGA